MIVQQQVPLPRWILRPPSERVDGRPLGGGTDESQFLSVRPVRFRRPFNRGRHGSTLRPPCPQPRHGGQIRFARPRDKLDPASKDFGSKLQTGTADHATAGTDSPKPNGSDKRIGDDLGSHTKKSAKGVSDKTDPDAERTTVHGLHHTATRGSSSSGNEGSADHPIDLRITVHQGREIGKSVKERLFRKPKTALATGTGLNQQHSRDQQSARALHRNAIGAIVGTEKTIKHDFATVGPAAAPVLLPQPCLRSVQPASDWCACPNPKVVVGAAPTNGSSPPAAPNGNRAADNAALVIVARNGPSISGTGLVRPGSGTGSIGGSPKIAAGIISGNSVHLKRP
jgi:hypothetical protein